MRACRRFLGGPESDRGDRSGRSHRQNEPGRTSARSRARGKESAGRNPRIGGQRCHRFGRADQCGAHQGNATGRSCAGAGGTFLAFCRWRIRLRTWVGRIWQCGLPASGRPVMRRCGGAAAQKKAPPSRRGELDAAGCRRNWGFLRQTTNRHWSGLRDHAARRRCRRIPAGTIGPWSNGGNALAERAKKNERPRHCRRGQFHVV